MSPCYYVSGYVKQSLKVIFYTQKDNRLNTKCELNCVFRCQRDTGVSLSFGTVHLEHFAGYFNWEHLGAQSLS